jgi:hypothetical protein
MLSNATRICNAKFGMLFRFEGGLFHPTALLDVPAAYADFLTRQGAFTGKPGQLFGRLCESKEVIHVIDRASEPEQSPSARLGGARSSIAVPMLKDNALWRLLYISHRSPPIYRQANRASEKLRRPGRYRHREHATAQ